MNISLNISIFAFKIALQLLIACESYTRTFVHNFVQYSYSRTMHSILLLLDKIIILYTVQVYIKLEWIILYKVHFFL